MRLRQGRRGLTVVAVAAGLLVALGAAPSARGAAPIEGSYRGTHLLQVTGSLAAGFKVTAAETWTISKVCTIQAGTLLEQYTPAGGSSYQVRWLNVWVPMNPDAPGAKCEFVFDGGPITVTVTATATALSFGGCNGDACALTGQALKRVGAPTTTTTKAKPPPPTTVAKPKPTKDTTPPRITAVSPKGFAQLNGKVALVVSLRDDSGRAKVHMTVYQGGTRLDAINTVLKADGVTGVSWPVPANAKGPLYFCAWAEDAAGNKSSEKRNAYTQPEFRDEPGRSCAWIPLVVPVEQVSNTCGGEGWDALVEVQHYFGNVHTYSNSNTDPSAPTYTVDFSSACNVHDAAYGGHAVWDVFKGTQAHDFRTMGRPKIDLEFLANMRKLCAAGIPATAKVAMAKCTGTGGPASVGAERLYNLVKKIGWQFFDADLTKSGLQKIGHRDNFD